MGHLTANTNLRPIGNTRWPTYANIRHFNTEQLTRLTGQGPITNLAEALLATDIVQQNNQAERPTLAEPQIVQNLEQLHQEWYRTPIRFNEDEELI